MNVGRIWRKSSGGAWRRLQCTVLAALLGALGAPLAWAADVTISAAYRGEASGQFENTTPPAGFCSEWAWNCSGNDTVELPISFTKITEQGTSDARDRFYFKLPGRRQVSVVSHSTGATYNVTFEFLQLSQELRRLAGTAIMPVMGGMPKGGCSLVINTSFPDRARYIWNVTTSANPDACWADAGRPGDMVTSAVDKTGIKYRLIMPRPVGIPQGVYTGSTQFRVGPGGDLDFGNGVSNLNDTLLTVHFELSVEHDLYVLMPPGGDRAVLEPPGGLDAWSSGRGQPTKLVRDLPLRVWSTGPFKVYKRCEYAAGDRCGIRNPDSRQVPVRVSLSVPGNVQHGNAQALDVVLPTGSAGAPVFEPQAILLNRPARLRFQVDGSDIAGMEAGSTYQGEVVIVFEAEI